VNLTEVIDINREDKKETLQVNKLKNKIQRKIFIRIKKQKQEVKILTVKKINVKHMYQIHPRRK